MDQQLLNEVLSLKVRTVKSLDVTIHEGIVTLTGYTRRYYFKQMAQEEAKKLLNQHNFAFRKINNEIEVK